MSHEYLRSKVTLIGSPEWNWYGWFAKWLSWSWRRGCGIFGRWRDFYCWVIVSVTLCIWWKYEKLKIHLDDFPNPHSILSFSKNYNSLPKVFFVFRMNSRIRCNFLPCEQCVHQSDCKLSITRIEKRRRTDKAINLSV